MAKRTITGTISFSVSNVPITLEIDIPEPGPGPEPPSVSWAHDILGTSTPAQGLNGPLLTADAQARKFDMPESLEDLPERTDLQAQLDHAARVCTLEPGIYRCSATINRPLEVRGNQLVSIRASDNWSPSYGACQWSSDGNNTWLSSLQVPDWPVENLQPYEATDPWRAGRPWIVMLDGVRFFIEPYTGTPSAGHFQLDNYRVLLPIDPSGHLVEVSTRGGAGAWLNITSDDVVLDAIDFRHAPSGQNRWNALESNGKKISEINCMFGWTHACGPAPGGSTGSYLAGNVYHNSGVSGLNAPNMNGLSFRNNVLFNNGFGEGWLRENGAGGIKVIASDSVTFEGNAGWNNNMAALWTDIDCTNSTFKGNVCWDNGAMQIHHEISEDGAIVDNVVFRTTNFLQPTERTLGFYPSSSRTTHIANNLAMQLPSMYEVRWTVRSDQPAGGCNGLVVEDNVAIGRFFPADQAGQWGHDFGLAWLDSEGGALINDPSNVARNNRYGYPGPEPEPRWSHSTSGGDQWLSTIADLQAQANIGQGASYLSDSEQTAYLTRFGLSNS